MFDKLADALCVEVDVKQLAVPQSLGDCVGEVEAAHCFVRELWVEADHFRPLQFVDKRDRVTDSWQEHVAARLVWFWFEREL